MKPTTKRRRRKIRHHQIKSPDDDDGLSHISPRSQQMHLLHQQLIANNHYHYQRHQKSVLSTHLIILYCLIMICIIDNLNPSSLQVSPVVHAAPSSLNHHFSKIASMVTGSSPSPESESAPATTLGAVPASVSTSSSSLSSTPTSSATLVKSARLATYSLTCPPEASIHPCTCLYHMPGALIESDEEEIYEISSAITTPIAEQLIMTSSSSTTTTTLPPPMTTATATATTTTTTTTTTTNSSNTSTTTTAPPPLLTQSSHSQAPSTHHASDQISTTVAPTTTRPPTVEESSTTASPATTTSTTTTTTSQPSSSSIAPPSVAAQSNATTIDPLSTRSNSNDGSNSSSTSTSSNNGSGSSSLHPQELVTQIQPQLQVQAQQSQPVFSDLKLQTLPAYPLEEQPQQQVVVGGENRGVLFALATTEAPVDVSSPAPVVSVTTEAPATLTGTGISASQASDQSVVTSGSNSPVKLEATISTTNETHNITNSVASTTATEEAAAPPKAQTSSSFVAPSNLAVTISNATIEALSTSGWLEPQALVTQAQPQEQQSPLASSLELQSLPKDLLPQQQSQQLEQQVVAVVVNTTHSASANFTIKADSPSPALVESLTTAAAALAPAAGQISETNSSQVANRSISAINSPMTPMSTVSAATVAHQTTTAPASSTAAPELTTTAKPATTESLAKASSSTTTTPPTTTTQTPISNSTTGNQSATIGESTTASPTLSTSAATPVASPASSSMRMATASQSLSLTLAPSASPKQEPVRETITASSSPAPVPIGAASAALFATLSNVTHAPPPPISPSPPSVAPSVLLPTATLPATTAPLSIANGTARKPSSHAQASSISNGHAAQATNFGSGFGGKDHTSALSHLSTTTTNTTTTRAPHRASASAEPGTSVKPTMSTSSTTTAPPLHPASSVDVGGGQSRASGRASSNGRAIQSRHAGPVSNPTAAPAQATSASPSTPALPPSHSTPTPTHSSTTAPVLAQHHQSSAATSQQPAQTQAQANGGSGRQILTPSSQRLRPGLHRHRSPALTSASTSTTSTTTTTSKPQPVREARAVSGTEAAAAEHLASFTTTQRLPGGRRLTRYLAHQDGSGGFIFGGGGPGGESGGEPKAEVMAFCRNIQNPQVLRDAIKGFRGHQINYFVIDSCRVPPFPNDLFVGIDVRWLEMTNSTVQFHNNFLHPRCNAAFELCARKPGR